MHPLNVKEGWQDTLLDVSANTFSEGPHRKAFFCLLFQVKELICMGAWLWVQVHILENKQNAGVLEKLLCFVISVRVAKRAAKQLLCFSVCLSVSVCLCL